MQSGWLDWLPDLEFPVENFLKKRSMGLVKSLWMEAEERGWHEVDRFVCDRCVHDEFLKAEVRASADELKCGYCFRRSRRAIAAPVGVLQQLVADAIAYYFADPNSAGLPWDGGWIVETHGVWDVLETVGFRCEEKLYEDITNAFVTDAWIPAANGCSSKCSGANKAISARRT